MGGFIQLPLLRYVLVHFLLAASIVAGDLTAGDDVLPSFIELPAGDDELRTFIVHVQPPENLVLGTADDRAAWYRSFLPEDGRLVHAYHHVASGFAARLTRREVDAMSAMPGFLAAQPDQVYHLLTTYTPRFLGLDVPQQGADDGRNHSNVGFGDGVIIGVPDSGVFADHPSFSGDGVPPPPARWKGRCDLDGSACNNKLIGAQSFESDPSPLDPTGHGTHVASTAAGNVVPGAQLLGQARGAASGIAPRAHLAVYKVCARECSGAGILAGIDAAVGDGCDVISISIAGDGPELPYHQSPLAVATFGAVEKGVFVSIGAGNSGPGVSTLYNDAPWHLSVSASTVDRLIGAQVRLGNGLSFDGESVYQPDISPDVFYPLVDAGSMTYSAKYCVPGSLEGLDLEGKIVLCYRGGGGGGRVVKGSEVKRVGGVGMIMANEFKDGYSTMADVHALPASHVSFAAGESIRQYISSTANPVAKIVFQGTVLGTKPAPTIASFSSRGPSLRVPGILKPDISGPGVSILAACPVQVGPSADSGPTFNFDSGTSMATPHLGGVAALIKSKHPDWSPAAIRSAMMTTADPNDGSGTTPILDEQHQTASFFATGAGNVNPDKAVDPGLVYDIATDDYIGHLCSVYASREVSVIARRAVDCSAVEAIKDNELNYPSISVSFPWPSEATDAVEVGRTVRNVGKAPAVYRPYVDGLPSSVAVRVTPSSLEFTAANQEQSFTVSVTRGKGARGKVVQGALRLVSDEHTVRSPISITLE